MKVFLKRVQEGARLPEYAHEGDAGLDLFASEDIVIPSGEHRLVRTGFNIALEKGFEAQVRPKSGLALTHGLTVLNSPGTIDSSYRGEIKIIAINHGKEQYMVEKGKKIAQMVISRVEKADVIEVEELDATSRDRGGFGSTGLE